MPFMGRDWRSPGEAWVKTESLGWQRMKIIESQLHPGCHQSHSACSWPPRAQFGQHMANNCCEQTSARDEPNNVSVRAEDRLGGCMVSSILLSGSGTSSDSSPDSSRPASAMTSPTNSPEKNNAHHLHPITISSPYGKHSCCIHHHHVESPCASPKTSRSSSSSNNNNNNNNDNLLYSYHNESDRSSCLANANPHTHPGQPRLVTPSCLSPAISPTLSTGANTTNDAAAAETDNNGLYPRATDGHDATSVTNCSRATNSANFNPLILGSNPTQSRDSSCRSATQSPVGGHSSCPTSPTMRRASPSSHEPGNSADHFHDKSKLDVDSLPGDKTIERPNEQPETARQGLNSPDCHSNCSVCCCCCSAGNNHQHFCAQMNRWKENHPKTAPHCRISVRTREVAMYNTISEAFYRLDFCNAIHDIRRFNYICKLLHLLITQNLTSLSGCATKVLFTMLEQVAWEVSSNKTNIHVLKGLLHELRTMIEKYYCWGRPIGSSLLWQQHFHTIERISRIVDGIELSPPKQEGERVTFDKLPVEMVREILLRLNDYRDLVNSAQASPVMRTMIDSQNVWRQLCRYHFSEQQLKSALESHSLNLARRNTLRGIKYARTSSSDGRTSYRNPVSHQRSGPPGPSTPTSSSSSSSTSSSSSSSTSSSSSSASTLTGKTRSTREQIEQTSNRRMPSRTNNLSSSYVTSAVRMFDRDGLTGRTEANVDMASLSSVLANRRQRSANDLSESSSQQSSQSRPPTATANERSAPQQIDWERVFHQLRKRFDLKEEYADCLLLCRHCRCLFWKSFGHPCIKNDELPGESFKSNHSHEAGKQQRSQNNGNDNANSSPTDARIGRQEIQARPSVASLSRNFDRCPAQRSARPHDGENLPPAYVSAPAQAPLNRINNTNNEGIIINDASATGRPRQPFDNHYAQLQNRGANLRAHNARQPVANDNGNGTNQPGSRNELVPKHVTITPQAFLKFFSL